jgi:DNA polymerase I
LQPQAVSFLSVLFLIDASVYVFRAHYSMPPDLFDRSGNPAHALFGFARFIGDLLERARPKHIAVAFDETVATSFRNRLYPAYKANRTPTPPGLDLQFERCREFCALVGLAEFGSEEYEADDIIGTLACRMRREGLPSTLVTRDKDLAQLVREGDVYWDYTSQVQFRYHQIEARFGVVPERYADYLALTGDAVDNIRGVPGIGPKTAATLLREFASLEELYDNLAELPQLKLRRAGELPAILREHQEAAFLARRLTSIACDMPMTVDASTLLRRGPDVVGLTEFFDRHNFGPTIRRQTDRLAELPLH